MCRQAVALPSRLRACARPCSSFCRTFAAGCRAHWRGMPDLDVDRRWLAQGRADWRTVRLAEMGADMASVSPRRHASDHFETDLPGFVVRIIDRRQELANLRVQCLIVCGRVDFCRTGNDLSIDSDACCFRGVVSKNEIDGSGANVGESSRPFTLRGPEVRKVLREMCFQTSIEQLDPRLQQAMRTLHGPSHLLPL